MKPKTIMVVAGEASGDTLAAELVLALREELPKAAPNDAGNSQPLYASMEPRFFGAGGPRMASAGVDLAFDMTRHAVVGVWEPLKAVLKFRRFFRRLYALALDRQPDAVVCVDFGGFNLHFARAIRRYVVSRADWFHDWQPRLVQYVSPQVWASRPGRARRIARDYDLLLSTLPFEKQWYAARTPGLAVEWVGHPILDRYRARGATKSTGPEWTPASPARIVMLPGSRRGELQRHLPLLTAVARRISGELPSQFYMVVPNEDLQRLAQTAVANFPGKVEVQVTGLDQALAEADLAITKSGTITLECACLGVPAVVFYKTSALTYAVARRMAQVKYISMPNLLADELLFPEFIQDAASSENVANASLVLLRDQDRRAKVKQRLGEVMKSLGEPGASRRAAKAIARLVTPGAGAGGPRP